VLVGPLWIDERRTTIEALLMSECEGERVLGEWERVLGEWERVLGE